MRRFVLPENLWQDLRYGFRLLAKSPGFTAVVVLSLALGIGANTAIFSLIDAVMLRMLPVKNPEQLAVLSWASPQWESTFHNYSGWGGCGDRPGMKSGCSFSYPVFEDIRSQSGVFTDVLADGGSDRVNLVVNGGAGLADAEPVSGGYFATLGVQPVLGRALAPDDDRPGAAPVAVIGEGLWERRFGREASVLGKAISVNGTTFTVVGVAPARFPGLQPGLRKDLWIPLRLLPKIMPSLKASTFQQRDSWWVVIVGRLRPGISEAKARAALNVIFQQGLHAAPKPQQLPHVEISSASKGLEILRQFYSKPLLILMGVVGLVLLIACANVANLLLARATARQKEIAVRLSLGASRRRLVRQLLAEGLLLSLAGGAVGLALGYWLSDVLMALVAAGPIPISLDVRPDTRVFAFTLAISVITGLLFGIAPALRGTLVDLSPALKASAGSLFRAAGHRGRPGLGKGLVAAQVAMSLLLLIGAGLFVRTLVNLETVNLGFNPRNILLFGLDMRQSVRKGRTATFYQDLLERLQVVPGVTSVSLSRATLVSGSVMKADLTFEGYTPAPHEDTSADVLDVGPHFFETMGIPLRLGRTTDLQDAERDVAVVNEALARRYYRGRNPVGQHFRGEGTDTKETEIVGVVGDAKYDDLREQAPPTIYVPYRLGSRNPGRVYFELRTAGDPNALISTVRRIVEQMDSDLPLMDVKTQTAQIDEMLYQERMFAKLTSAFGLLALVLACVGLYGIMAYAVARRTGEIGIRMALGAERRTILAMVMRETLLLVGVGVAIGIPAALAATRLISSILFGIKPGDPATLATATAVMLAVAAFAGYLPARRASRVDPMVALRDE